MDNLTRQLAAARSLPVPVGDWRAAKAKRRECQRLEVEQLKRRKWRDDPGWVPPF